jgi:hypothetical protein
VILVDGVPVGVTAVLSPVVLDSVETAAARFVATSPTAAAASALADLRAAGARVTVLLAHMTYPEARALIRDVPGFDVVVVGHSPGVRASHGVERGTVVVRPGSRGRWVAEVRLELGSQGVEAVSGAVMGLGRDHPEDLEVGRWVAGVQSEVEAARREALRVARAPSREGPRLLGAAACQECHAEVHASWEATPHARAFETLVEVGMSGAPECVRCHVTGAETGTGWGGSAPSAPEAGWAPELRGVQCEACHAVPSHHPEPPEVPPVEPVSCRRCHDPTNSPGFDPPVYWEKILHGVDGP